MIINVHSILDHAIRNRSPVLFIDRTEVLLFMILARHEKVDMNCVPPRFYQDVFRAWKRQTRFSLTTSQPFRTRYFSNFIQVSYWCSNVKCIVNAAPDLSLILGQHWTARDSVVDGPSSVPPITTWTNKNTAVTRNYRPMSLGRRVANFLRRVVFHIYVFVGMYRCKRAEC